MFKKRQWKSNILSKDAGHRPPSLLKMSLFHRCFSNIFQVKSKYLVSTYETLAENGFSLFALFVFEFLFFSECFPFRFILSTLFMSVFFSYTPWKHQEIRYFLLLSGAGEGDQWNEMGEWAVQLLFWLHSRTNTRW